MEVILTVKEGLHIKPSFLNFKTFQEVSVCEDCKYTVAKEDINSLEPCPNCGGMFSGIKSFTGKWDTKRKEWLRRTKINNGKI